MPIIYTIIHPTNTNVTVVKTDVTNQYDLRTEISSTNSCRNMIDGTGVFEQLLVSSVTQALFPDHSDQIVQTFPPIKAKL